MQLLVELLVMEVPAELLETKLDVMVMLALRLSEVLLEEPLAFSKQVQVVVAGLR
jgi:hypothetical protein